MASPGEHARARSARARARDARAHTRARAAPPLVLSPPPSVVAFTSALEDARERGGQSKRVLTAFTGKRLCEQVRVCAEREESIARPLSA